MVNGIGAVLFLMQVNAHVCKQQYRVCLKALPCFAFRNKTESSWKTISGNKSWECFHCRPYEHIAHFLKESWPLSYVALLSCEREQW